MKILVTGGAGYIGSHTCLELLKAGYEVVVIDNLVNSNEESLRRVRELAGKDLEFHKVDLLDKESLRKVLVNSDVEAVIHFAGLKSVSESVENPLTYYKNNVGGTISLCEVMSELNINKFVFSSSATVYGDTEVLPVNESHSLSPPTPYGRCKLYVEEILADIHAASGADVVILRYFNPVGAHKSGRIGESSIDAPNNIMPSISLVAVGRLPELKVFGGDYDTPDGTGVRDFIHVVDLAKAHVKALEKLKDKPGYVTYNLGTGQGFTVKQLIEAFAEASGKDISYKIVDRREGDIAVSYADASLAEQELGWEAELGLKEMCEDTWRWQSTNPDGYN